MKKVVWALAASLLLMSSVATADTLTFSATGGNWSASPTAGNPLSANSAPGTDYKKNGTTFINNPFALIAFTTGNADASCTGPSSCTFDAGGSVYVFDGSNFWFLGSFTGGSSMSSSGGGFQFTGNFLGGNVTPVLATFMGWSSTSVTGKLEFDFNSDGTAASSQLDLVPFPEPGSLALLGSGLLALGGFLRRKIY